MPWPWQSVLTSFCPHQLSKYPTITNLERQSGVPKAYAVIGLVALYFFLIIFNLGGQLLTNLAGFVIPGYYSLNALFTTNKDDDTQWLTVPIPNPLLSIQVLLLTCAPTSIGLSLLSSLSWRASSTSSTGSPSTSSSSLCSSCGSRCRCSGK